MQDRVMYRLGMVFMLAAVIAVTGACSGSSGESASTRIESGDELQARVDELIGNDQYQQALDVIEASTDAADTLTLNKLREKTHLNFGLFLEYRGGDRDMRARMTNALRQYIKVLNINRQNQKALSEINQIMGIYNTMPDKTVPDDIKQGFEELGLNY